MSLLFDDLCVIMYIQVLYTILDNKNTVYWLLFLFDCRMSTSSSKESKIKSKVITKTKDIVTESSKDISESHHETDEISDYQLSTFDSLGVSPILCESIKSLGWTSPTEIQQKSIPYALNGRDIIGLAETGSGNLTFNYL